MITRHEPSRPSWRCAGCGDDWPCRSRQRQLLAETTGSTLPLALLMASYFEDAVSDHPTVALSALYARFFGWLRRQPRTG